MSAAMSVQATVAPAAVRARAHRASPAAPNRCLHVAASTSRAARRHVSCAAAPAKAEPVKDNRIPVTILTGFLG